MLVERIDDDKDGFVTEEEMKAWIKYAQKRWVYEEVDRQFKSHDLDEDGLVSWEEYKNATYGYLMGMTTDSPDSDGKAHYMIAYQRIYSAKKPKVHFLVCRGSRP